MSPIHGDSSVQCSSVACPDSANDPGDFPLLMAADDPDPARAFLRRVALLSICRLAAGQTASRQLNGPMVVAGREATGALVERRPVCSPPVAARFALIAGRSAGRYARFLPEWLSLFAAGGQALPAWYLPDLLDLGERQPPLREQVRVIAGERGRWLALHNEQWSWLPDAAATRRNPRAHTASLRESLLIRLAERLVEWHTERGRRQVIGISLPQTFDEEMRRSRTRRSPSSSAISAGLNDRQWWFHQLMVAIEPGHWCRRWNVTPERLVRAAAQSEHRDLLLPAWSEAAIRFTAVEWIEALLSERIDDPGAGAIDLFAALPADRQEPWLVRILRRETGLSAEHQAYGFLAVAKPPWGRRIGRLLLPLIAREFEQRVARALWDWQELLRLAASRLDVRLAGQAGQLLNEASLSASPLAPALAEFLEDLRFRAAMIGEI